MKPQIATASKVIPAPAPIVYNIIADYRKTHPAILPKPYFLSLDVEEGGVGEGTIVQFQMRILGQTQSFRALITEPEPGRVLQETDMDTQVPTTFTVQPLGHENHTKVTIQTELKNRGFMEGLLAKLLLQKIYGKELGLLAEIAENFKEAMPSTSEAKTLSIASK